MRVGEDPRAFSRRRLQVAAVVISAAFGLGTGALGVVLLVLDAPGSLNVFGASNSPVVVGFLLMGLAFGGCGAALALRRPENPVGWLYIAGGLLLLLATAVPEYAFAIFQMHRGLPGRTLAAALGNWSWSLVALFFLFASALVFPTGKLLGPRWRWAAAVTGLSLMVVVLTMAVSPGRAVPGVGAPNPIGLNGSWAVAVGEALLAPALLVPALLAVAALVWRWRRGSALERLQIRWPATTTAVALALFFAAYTLSSGWAYFLLSYLLVLAFVAVPASVLVAISRYRLYDLDRLVSRTLAYLAVTAVLGGVYVGGVALATRVLPFSTPLGVAASTLAAAALFSPLRKRVQRLVDRRFNRARYDADSVVAAFASRLRSQVDPDLVLADLVGTVATAVEPALVSVWTPNR